jgi:ABC-type nitrate/sulfonate/bicarbonate transport system substrate-binding protein
MMNLSLYARGRRPRATVLVAAGVVMACAACSSNSSTTAATSSHKITPITIDISGVTGDEIPILVADGQNLWKKYGISVDLKQLGTAIEFTALATDQVQISIGGITGLEQAQKGAPIRLIGSLGPSYGEFLVQAGINKPSDVTGKTLGATTSGSTSDNIQRLYLEEHGVPTSKYTTDYFQGNLASVVAALSRKQIAGTFVEPPFLYQATTADTTLHPLGDIDSSNVGALTPNLVYVNTTWSKSHEAAVTAFIKGWRAAIAESKAEPSVAIKDLAAATSTTTTIATDWYHKQVGLDTFGKETEASFAIQVKALAFSDPTVANVTYSQIVDNSYLSRS